MSRTRLAVAALSLSAAGLVGIANWEGFAPVAQPPVAGDVPTYGYGATRRADGSPVRAGETITPPAALALAARQIRQDFEPAIRGCITVPLTQGEYDAYTSLSYNIGPRAFCGSTLARRLNAGDYPGACAEILRWDKFRGRQIQGLTNRRRDEFHRCVGSEP